MNLSYNVTPSFIDGSAGKLFALHYAPLKISEKSECIIIAASFAEEMNRCRYMSTLLAQSLANHGYGFISVDAYGTGDSEGDFKDAGWEQACQDLLAGISYAYTLGYQKITLLGVRLGALQALKVSSEISNLKRLIFWQPLINGQSALVQFLRIKIAASMNRDEKPETIQSLEAQIESGNHINVSGYDVSPELFRGTQATKFDDYIDSVSVPVGWFTVLSSADRKTPRGDMMLIDKWRQNGTKIIHQELIGIPFWQTHERALVPELVDATIQHVIETD